MMHPPGCVRAGRACAGSELFGSSSRVWMPTSKCLIVSDGFHAASQVKSTQAKSNQVKSSQVTLRRQRGGGGVAWGRVLCGAAACVRERGVL